MKIELAARDNSNLEGAKMRVQLACVSAAFALAFLSAAQDNTAVAAGEGKITGGVKETASSRGVVAPADREAGRRGWSIQRVLAVSVLPACLARSSAIFCAMAMICTPARSSWGLK